MEKEKKKNLIIGESGLLFFIVIFLWAYYNKNFFELNITKLLVVILSPAYFGYLIGRNSKKA
ncbi:MAG: hypothetical protein KAS07_00800 [Candidatus Pacebacteria bacterium]|nr:hypothetical protein [Candidatus Paceibacterota bacterium]